MEVPWERISGTSMHDKDECSRPEAFDQILAQVARERLAALGEEFAARGRLSAHACAEFQALAAIAQIQSGSRHIRHRWVPVLLFFLTVALVGLLFFTHVASTRIDLDAEVSEFGFTPDREDVLGWTRLRELKAIGAHLDSPIFDNAPKGCQPDAFDGLISVTILDTSNGESAVGLTGLVLPRGAQVTFSHSGINRRYQVSIEKVPNPPAKEATLTATGKKRVEGAGSCRLELDGLQSVSLHLLSGSRLDLVLEPISDALPGDVGIAAKDLTLLRTDIAGSRRLSNVLAGTLYFDAIPGKQRKLRTGEGIAFTDSFGVIHVLSATKDRIKLRFTGIVDDVRTGEDDGKSSLMPTWYEWLKATHGLFALSGAALYLFGLALALVRWWGVDA
jgi:hypothetical protein